MDIRRDCTSSRAADQRAYQTSNEATGRESDSAPNHDIWGLRVRVPQGESLFASARLAREACAGHAARNRVLAYGTRTNLEVCLEDCFYFTRAYYAAWSATKAHATTNSYTEYLEVATYTDLTLGTRSLRLQRARLV